MTSANKSSRPVVFIIGETATGKTNLAHELAQIINGEIVNADSTNTRKELTIGTDKPTQSMMSQVKYHLVDIVSLKDNFSVADYKKIAQETLHKIWLNKKVPIIVGGSGLYVNSIIYNYDFISTDRKEYSNLEDKTLDELISIAKTKNLQLTHIDMKNKRRLVNFIKNDGRIGTKNPTDSTDMLIIGTKIDRPDLNKNIEKRVDRMIRAGLEEEVRSLLSDPTMKKEYLNIIGYKEWSDYFIGKSNLNEVKEQIIKDTKVLAKKQRTWFRNKIDYKINWLDYPYKLEDVVAMVTTFLDN